MNNMKAYVLISHSAHMLKLLFRLPNVIYAHPFTLITRPAMPIESSQTYVQVTPDVPEVEQSVRIVPLSSSISMIVAPVTPTLLPLFVAEAAVKVTVPKSAKLTRDPPDSKSSTIHSALYSQRDPKLASLLKVWVTVFPLVLLTILAVPPVLLLAVTVTVMESPAASGMLDEEKSYA